MQFTLATMVLAAATVVSAQGVTSLLTPTASAPAGCSTSYAGKFEITVVLPSTKKRSVQKRATCAGDGTLVASLTGGILTDAVGRIGAIVANHQFQFDGPPAQTGSIYTGGWSVCGNGSLALGGSAVFYECLSGTFYNLYDKSIGGQCKQVIIDVIPCTSSSVATGVTQISDGQVKASSAATKVTQISDGQVQASSAVTKVTQISDGQIQASSAAPKPVSQFTDGQIQVTASPSKVPAPVTQISDGQIQATSAATKVTSAAVTLKTSTTSATKAPVSQISDGQIQATAAANATITKAPTTTPAATAGGVSSTFTGAAAYMTAGANMIAGAAAVVAVAFL